jgi:hypothetical protein
MSAQQKRPRRLRNRLGEYALRFIDDRGMEEHLRA